MRRGEGFIDDLDNFKVRQGHSEGHVCQGESDMENARAAGLQVKGENEQEHCNILHCSSLSLSGLVPACATGKARIRIRSDQTRQASLLR